MINKFTDQNEYIHVQEGTCTLFPMNVTYIPLKYMINQMMRTDFVNILRESNFRLHFWNLHEIDFC